MNRNNAGFLSVPQSCSAPLVHRAPWPLAVPLIAETLLCSVCCRCGCLDRASSRSAAPCRWVCELPRRLPLDAASSPESVSETPGTAESACAAGACCTPLVTVLASSDASSTWLLPLLLPPLPAGCRLPVSATAGSLRLRRCCCVCCCCWKSAESDSAVTAEVDWGSVGAVAWCRAELTHTSSTAMGKQASQDLRSQLLCRGNPTGARDGDIITWSKHADLHVLACSWRLHGEAGIQRRRRW